MENDKLLKLIANSLLSNMSNCNGVGLFGGKLGISIFFFEYGRITGRKQYKYLAESLLDDIYEQTTEDIGIDLADGLSGIGIGLLFLLRENYISGNVKEVLKSIDEFLIENNEIVKLHEDVITEYPLFSIGLYTYFRMKMAKANEQDYIKGKLLAMINYCKNVLFVTENRTHCSSYVESFMWVAKRMQNTYAVTSVNNSFNFRCRNINEIIDTHDYKNLRYHCWLNYIYRRKDVNKLNVLHVLKNMIYDINHMGEKSNYILSSLGINIINNLKIKSL